MKRDVVLFIQKRTGKSGAPAALLRLLAQKSIASLNPVLLAEKEGWLTQQCAEKGVPYLLQPFPSSRSWAGKLWLNRAFARRVVKMLSQQNSRARLIVGNDHLEGILARELGKAAAAPTAMFLRSSQTTRKDYFKYQCHKADLIYTVGDDLRRRVLSWHPASQAKLLDDGLVEEDFSPPKPKAAAFPQRILVVGTEGQHKGWQDFAAAVELLESDSHFPALDFDFTGQPPASPRRCKFHGVGRHENFREVVRRYDLVIHPSRMESFGLAMAEILAAGVPLLCSRVGVIEKIQKNPLLLFEPNNPRDMAKKIRHLRLHWPEINFELEACQERLRLDFAADKIASQLADDFSQLLQRVGSVLN
ncbi:MAG: glycosyltransferase family 4 protein [bacterium]